MMFSHVTIGISDFERALGFYRPLMDALGLVEKFSTPDVGRQWAGYMRPGIDRPLFIITEPWDGKAASPGNGAMVAFQVAARAEVAAAHALALELGATDEGAPGLRLQYHESYYGAYFRDPFGNKLCVVCHDDA